MNRWKLRALGQAFVSILSGSAQEACALQGPRGVAIGEGAGGRLPDEGWWGGLSSWPGLGTPPGPTLLDLGCLGAPIKEQMCGSNMQRLRGTPVCS